MATRKAAKAGVLSRLGAVLFPADAFGLTRLPEEQASSAEAAKLLGLGFPHGAFLTSEPVEPCKDGSEFAKRYARPGLVPRDAIAQAYAVHQAPPDATAMTKAMNAKPKVPALKKALDDALKYGNAWTLWMIEAMHGSVPVAEALVDLLTKRPAKQWKGTFDTRTQYLVIYGLDAVVLRVPTALRTKLRARLAEKLEELRADDPELWRPAAALDVIISGREGVERSGRGFNGRLFLSEYEYATDDPSWALGELRQRLTNLRPADRETADLQLGVVCGPEAVKLLRASLPKFFKDSRAESEDHLTLFA